MYEILNQAGVLSQNVVMDFATLLNIIGGIFIFIIACIVSLLSWIVRNLIIDVKKIESALPDKYVRKDDYRVDITELKNGLNRIFERLDGKADK